MNKGNGDTLVKTTQEVRNPIDASLILNHIQQTNPKIKRGRDGET